jgi:hypothetical protein
MTLIGYERYCKRVESSGEWGGEPEVSPHTFGVCPISLKRELIISGRIVFLDPRVVAILQGSLASALSSLSSPPLSDPLPSPLLPIRPRSTSSKVRIQKSSSIALIPKQNLRSNLAKPRRFEPAGSRTIVGSTVSVSLPPSLLPIRVFRGLGMLIQKRLLIFIHSVVLPHGRRIQANTTTACGRSPTTWAGSLLWCRCDRSFPSYASRLIYVVLDPARFGLPSSRVILLSL